jgi:hypothetical protein
MDNLQFEEKKEGYGGFEVIQQNDLGGRGKPSRQYVDTKKIGDAPTPLNYKKVDIRVSEAVIKDGGVFSSNYITYKIETKPLGYEVRRKDADFFFLRKILTKCYPHVVVPPLPSKAPKASPKYFKKREKYYQRFLQAISRCEELKNN